MAKFVGGSNNQVGTKQKPCSAVRRESQRENAQRVRGTRYDEDTKKLIGDARTRGARALPEVIDDIVRIATTGYTRYTELDGKYRFVRVEPETRMYAARYLGDRCGLPPRAETEIDTPDGMPMTLIVMSEDAQD